MSNDDLIIRRFTEGDSLEELTALYHRAYADHAAAGRVYYASYQTVDDTRRRISNAECWIATRHATQNAAIVGTVTIRAPLREPAGYPAPPDSAPGDAGSFSTLCVLPELRGTGLGNRLRVLAEERLLALGMKHAVINTSSLAAQLIGWYQRCGYAPIGTWKFDVTNYQSTVLSKTL